ncbi:MAG TPA: integrase arm-type DNA-binding domain-containing protein [Stellaceae bacterium]|nr:integrase arm-type DNA-binding domain-containing protein [Stellaceae bacterium]
MAVQKLSAVMVRGAKGTAGKTQMLGDGGGLYFRIGPTGARSWIYRYQDARKQHDFGLGPYPAISLAEARDRAAEQRKLRLDGHDPISERKVRRASARVEAARLVTFRECAERYIAANRTGWREGSRSEKLWIATLAEYVYPVFGDLPVAMIDTPLVLKAVEPLWTGKTETASRVRGRIEKVLDYATVSKLRSGENPARWRGHLEHLLPEKSKVAATTHRAALPYAEVGAFMAELRQQDSVAARALEFAILTAARRSEVVGARWNEFDFPERRWIIPAGRMKGGREHRAALSDAAVAIIEGEPRNDDLVFPGLKDGKPLLAVLARMKRSSLTLHGFRSTFADWAAERTAFPNDVVELALAHKVGNAVERAYRRPEQFQRRRQLAELWAQFCATATAAGDVVPIRA